MEKEWKWDPSYQTYFEIRNQFYFSVPPERLTIEGPDELTPGYDARFACKASASNLPSKLTFKLTSHQADLLDNLVSAGLVEIEESQEKWIDSTELSGWSSSRSVTIKKELLEKASELGEQIAFECQVPDPYHERRILVSATKFVTLHSEYKTSHKASGSLKVT